MYFYVKYAHIFLDFFKAIILLKKLFMKKSVFYVERGGGGGMELKIPREVIILHA